MTGRMHYLQIHKWTLIKGICLLYIRQELASSILKCIEITSKIYIPTACSIHQNFYIRIQLLSFQVKGVTYNPCSNKLKLIQASKTISEIPSSKYSFWWIEKKVILKIYYHNWKDITVNVNGCTRETLKSHRDQGRECLMANSRILAIFLIVSHLVLVCLNTLCIRM